MLLLSMSFFLGHILISFYLEPCTYNILFSFKNTLETTNACQSEFLIKIRQPVVLLLAKMVEDFVSLHNFGEQCTVVSKWSIAICYSGKVLEILFR